MEIIVGAIVLIGAVTLLNLLLTLAVIRRLRQMGEPAPGAPTATSLEEHPVGAPIPSFRAEDLTGRTVASEDHVGQETVYAFFDTGCSLCKSRLEPLVERVRTRGMRPEQVVAVIGGPQGDTDSYTAALQGHATLIVEESLGKVAQAFSLGGVPTIILADAEGRVLRSGVELDVLSAAAS